LEKAVAGVRPARKRRTRAWAAFAAPWTLADFGACDLTVEAAVKSYADQEAALCGPGRGSAAHAILASNTSSLCVTEMASATKRATRCWAFTSLTLYRSCPSSSSSAPS
jgi:3-hydroxyacyl-CoA dehydrogenase